MTSRGNAKAARIQADAATAAQRIERLHEARRAAYLDFIHHGQRMADLYWKESEPTAYSDQNGCSAAVDGFRSRI
ncbi:hypothetical protein [Streptomyces mirabilis]|uniref:hypothetical protein n=1 Tax=Streptomyces mirabilis TaxID=68239 RepID=UPI0036919606